MPHNIPSPGCQSVIGPVRSVAIVSSTNHSRSEPTKILDPVRSALYSLCLILVTMWIFERDFVSFGVCRLIMYALMSLSYGLMTAPQKQLFFWLLNYDSYNMNHNRTEIFFQFSSNFSIRLCSRAKESSMFHNSM